MWQFCLHLLLTLVKAEDFQYNIGSPDICSATTQTSKLFADTHVPTYLYQGFDVAISRNGTYLIVSSILDSTNGQSTGGFWPYIFNPLTNTYIPDQDTPTPLQPIRSGFNVSNTSYQGFSIAIADDGTVAIGAPGDQPVGNFDTGAVWIWIRNPTHPAKWVEKQKLVGPQNSSPNNAPVIGGYNGQGVGVALSGDGDLLASSSFAEPNPGGTRVGAVWIWSRNPVTTNYTYQTKIYGFGNVAGFGWSIDFSLDGSILAIGSVENLTLSSSDNMTHGGVYIFTHPPNDLLTWTLVQPVLKGSVPFGVTSYQGMTVSLSDDGKTLSFGGVLIFDTGFDIFGNSLYVWITNSSNLWVQAQEFDGIGIYAQSQFGLTGHYGRLSGDGQVLAIGSSLSDPLGGVTLYLRNSSVVNPDSTHPLFLRRSSSCQIVGSGGLSSYQGEAVALDEHGHTLVSGGPGDNNGLGAVWVFTDKPSTNGSYTDCLEDGSTRLGNPLYFQIYCPLGVYYSYPSLNCDSDRQGPFPLPVDQCFQALAYKNLPSFSYLNVHCTCPKGQYENAQGACVAQTPTALKMTLLSVVDGKNYLASNQNINIVVSNNPAGSGSTPTGYVTFRVQTATKNLGIVKLINGKATFNTLNAPTKFQGPLTIVVSYEGDNTHSPISANFDVFFYRFPTAGAYLVANANVTGASKIGTTILFYGTQGAWLDANPQFRNSINPFNGWTPNKNLALKCNTTFSVSKSDNKQSFRYLGIVAVDSIGATAQHTSKIAKIAVVDTNGKPDGEGKLLATLCPLSP